MAVKTPYKILFEQVGKEFNLDPDILQSISLTENISQVPTLTGDAGKSIGLMQVYQKTWVDFAKRMGMSWDELRDPLKNIRAGAAILKSKLERYGDPLRAVVGYNGHAGRFTFGGVAYLSRVLSHYANIKGVKINPPLPLEDPVLIGLMLILALGIATRK
jgi:soluble lytic murein transglycosylase-like protein